jgi:hypothetical protein
MCIDKHLLLAVKPKEVYLSVYDGGYERVTIAIE